MKFFPQAQMQSPPDMCTHALFILPKEKGESKGMGKYFLGSRFKVQGSGFRVVVAASPQVLYEAMPEGLLIADLPRIVSPLAGKVPRRGG